MLVATIVLSITGCMDRRQGATASRHPKDTLYTEQRAMEAYDYQPERALQMVDSAVAVGDMNHWWGEMLRARIDSVEYPLDVTGKTWQYFRLEIINTRNSLSPKLPSRPPTPQRCYCAATTASDAVYRVSAGYEYNNV